MTPTKKTYDYSSCFRFVKPYVDSVDLAIGNLELTLAGPPYTGYPQFGSPDALGTTLKDIGFDVLVTANNHCVDRGRKGLERTIMMLDSFKIAHTGTFVDSLARVNESPLIVEKNGFKLAILNYTYGTNGIPVTSAEHCESPGYGRHAKRPDGSKRSKTRCYNCVHALGIGIPEPAGQKRKRFD